MNTCFTEKNASRVKVILRHAERRKIFLLTFIICVLLSPSGAVRVQAIDPVTIAILTPVALKCAEIAAPYVWRGLQNGGRHMLKVSENIIDFFRLPVGILQATLGAPFGLFSTGMKNIVSGTLAPFSLTLNVLLMPLAFSGMNLNST